MSRRLTLVIHSLAAGGAERVLSLLASNWARRGDSVTLLTFDDGATPPFYPLDSQVTHRPLALAGSSESILQGILNNRHRIRVLREAIRASAPDAVVAFMVTSNVLSLLAARPLGLPVIVSERSDPAVHHVGKWRSFLRTRLYPRAAGVVMVTESARQSLPSRSQALATVIPNPVLAVERRPESHTDGPRLQVTALGRLSREKGFDLLLDAFARVAKVHPGWKLTIWGEGTERANLESQRSRLDLDGVVDLPGATRSPQAALQAADIFVLPSRFEGFPNALCEAMACGLPTVSFDCESGPREIVTHDADGLLVPPEDTTALAEALIGLIDNGAMRARLGGRAIESVQRFNMDAVMVRWDACLDRVARS